MQSASHVPVIEALGRRRRQVLDIFRKEPEGGVLWVGTAKDDEEVKEMFKKLHVASPYDHSTGIKRTMKPEEFGGDVQP
jgi:hypothetical protein